MTNEFPRLDLSTLQLPDSKDWEVGKQYEIVVTVEMTGQRKAEQYDVPTMDASESERPNNGIMINSFQIKDVQTEEQDEQDDAEEGEDGGDEADDVSEEMDPTGETATDFESEYAQKRSAANISININH